MNAPVRSMVPEKPFHQEQLAPGVSLRRLYPGGKLGPDEITRNDIPGGQTWSEIVMLGNEDDDFIMGLPDAYDTRLGERGYSLSGGQRQRIAIARAILADPRILVLDDATSAVDPSKEHEIRSAMSTVMDGRTTIVIAHRPGTIALADRVALLDGGRVAALGTHDELLATDQRYRDVLAAMDRPDDASVTAGSAPDGGAG